jgi:hypothetical protein
MAFLLREATALRMTVAVLASIRSSIILFTTTAATPPFLPDGRLFDY